MNAGAEAVYDDGTYKVTAGIIATPTRIYPISNTTVRLRRDPLWAGASLSVFAASALAIYGDLLSGAEMVIGFAVGVSSLYLGQRYAVLQIDAVGHPKAIIFDKATKIRRLYQTIRSARLLDIRASHISHDEYTEAS